MIVLENVSKIFRIPHERTKTLFHKLLSLTKSGYTYEDLYALKDINLRVKPGEFLGIIGKNGSGKSTLLRIIAGVYRPTTGRVAVNEEISPLLELGLGFDSSFSALDNIYVYGALLGFTRQQMMKRVQNILDFAELQNFANVKLENLSTGMKMRLAFSIAIQSVAPIILVDEALAVGDKIFAQKCRDVFRRFKDEGRTILLVSHDLGSIEEFCNRVIVIDKGKLVAEGGPAEVVKYYNDVVLPSSGQIPYINLSMVEHVSSSTTTGEEESLIIIDETAKQKVVSAFNLPSVKNDSQKKITQKSLVTKEYNPEQFWNKRLSENFNLRGVGNIMLDESYNELLYRQRISVLENIITKYRIELEGKNVLDLGCGIGYFTKFYLSRGAKITGVDISEYAVNKIKKLYPNTEFICADITNADEIFKRSYDIVHIFATTIHIIDDINFNNVLTKIGRSLKKGGYCFITDEFPSYDSSPAPHVKFRCKERYQLLEENGLNILEIRPIHRFLKNKAKPGIKNKSNFSVSMRSMVDSILNTINFPGGSSDLKLLVAWKSNKRK
jgi:ABC-type polysaccharide/polyol phosphate transport system ATPase subunit/SAM-dependent methyltransferase